jgi:release factor glutamine methyltransferase
MSAGGAPCQGERGITVAQALQQARAAGVERLDAQQLLGWRLGRPRSWLIAHDDAALDAAAALQFAADCRRLAQGEPLAYLLGECEFHGLRLRVTPAVLVPRPDTETLVDWALALLPTLPGRPPEVIDLGTGSGAIALALALAWPGARFTATDFSPAALVLAARNARELGLGLGLAEGRWWQAVPGRQFHLALSNPPYIAGDDPHLPALCHEPLLALTPGGDGLAALRDIVAGAPAQLHRGGWLLLEHGWDQADAVAALLAAAGFEAPTTRLDRAGRPRCTGARWA